jgi:branched-chain amino acid transport system ATP-binding protein
MSSQPIWGRKALFLEVNELNVFYKDVQALFGVSFHIDQGEIISIVGSNAAGKSTTINTISGILRPRSGTIVYNGRHMEKLSSDKMVEAGIVQIPEGRQLFPGMTVLENLEMGSFTKGAKKKRSQTLSWVFDFFPRLQERSTQMAGTLSGGEQQMLAIGRAFMALPQLLMFDEPSFGLAPIVVQEIFKTVKQVNHEGTTVLVVEQNVFHVLNMSSRAYVLENGRVVLEGTGKELLNNENVKKAYLGI